MAGAISSRRRAQQKGKSPAARSLRARTAAGLCGRRDFIAPARAAEVVSSNIVGYEKINVPVNAQNIVGVQFKAVGGTDDAISLQSLSPEGYSARGTDWIMIYDPVTSAYTKAFYWGEEADGGVYESPDEDADCLGPGWGDSNQTVIDIDIKNGEGFWTKSVAGGTLTVSGEVSSDNTVTIPANQMLLVTSKYPGQVNLQSIVPTGYSARGTDWIMVYDPSTSSYTKAFYWGEEADGGVYESPDEDADCLGPGWGDSNQTVINLTLEYGQGFWTKSVAGGTLAFPEVP